MEAPGETLTQDQAALVVVADLVDLEAAVLEAVVPEEAGNLLLFRETQISIL